MVAGEQSAEVGKHFYENDDGEDHQDADEDNFPRKVFATFVFVDRLTTARASFRLGTDWLLTGRAVNYLRG